MACGHHIRAKGPGGGKECIELYLPVAQDVRVGRAALGILVEHIVHDTLAVLLGKVHEVEGDANLARHHLRHELVLLPFAVSVKGALRVVPVLHEHSKYVIALPLEQQGGNAGVHAS